jgi:nitroreductase
MDIKALDKLIKERRSIRNWKKDNIPDELLRRAIELATWAPNGGNYQAWRFIAVKNRSTIINMANAVQSAADKVASWPEAKGWPEDVERNRNNASFFRNAPVCIGVFSKQYQSPMDRVLIERESFDDEAKKILKFRRSAPTAVQSAAAATTIMLLAFNQMGLGAVWLATPLLAKTEIETILQAPKNMDLICLVAAGYPNESPQKDRKHVDQALEIIY